MNDLTYFIDMDHALIDAILHSRGYTDTDITEIFSRTNYMKTYPEQLERVMLDVTEKHNKMIKATSCKLG